MTRQSSTLSDNTLAVAAKSAGLRYVRDGMPGLRRMGTGKVFRYVGPDGRRVRDSATLERVRRLAIPPAWRDVWICPIPEGHLQAVGRDARNRKQYRYHPRWREVRDETKFGRMIAFANALPRIRAAIRRDLGLPGLPREKVLATIVRLLETTYIRVGNEEYARQNSSFGLTTLRDRHVKVAGSEIHFYFSGKRQIRHRISVDDPSLARIVRHLRDLPGQELFQYLDDAGERRSISSTDVNDYLREIGGGDFTAKDFRTWAGTVLALEALCKVTAADGSRARKSGVLRAVEDVARSLGNTAAVCRKSYIHPAVLEGYSAQPFERYFREQPASRRRRGGTRLNPAERAVLRLLKAWSRAKKMPLAETLERSLRTIRRRNSKRKPAAAA